MILTLSSAYIPEVGSDHGVLNIGLLIKHLKENVGVQIKLLNETEIYPIARISYQLLCITNTNLMHLKDISIQFL